MSFTFIYVSTKQHVYECITSLLFHEYWLHIWCIKIRTSFTWTQTLLEALEDGMKPPSKSDACAQKCIGHMPCAYSVTHSVPGYSIFIPWKWQKPAVFGCFTNSIVPLPIVLENYSNPQTFRHAFYSTMKKTFSCFGFRFCVSDIISEEVFLAISAHAIWWRLNC